MNIKRIIIAGLALDIVSFIGIPSYKLFGWVFALEPSSIWKWTPSSGTTIPFASLSFSEWLFLLLVNTALAVFIAFLYALFYKSIPGNGIKKGLAFGLLIYPIGVIIPLFSVYYLMNVAVGALIYLASQGLFEFLLYGVVISLIYREKLLPSS
ncbi:MAG: hypothetical protein HYT40_03715 [Candidatus Sungbacteria bacterium]|uniref:Uncharacterized protein n=1 Tax=Candidatus Sungiibacteriota bacterium TaxID=2750080 RepID=A0A931WP08_9BACT|nr:hypothetical protein [Candidatus Sungbacteria bacterium]